MRTPCPKKRAARLSVNKASWQDERLTVSGRVAKAARKRVKVTARCGTTRATNRVKPRRGAWRATFTLQGRCASARRARVTATYPGGPNLRRATTAQRVVKSR
jgi:hypothetical protein